MNLAMTDFKKEFDGIFRLELEKLAKHAGDSVGSHITKNYVDYMVTVASNGKRIRPYNTALTYTIYSGKDWHEIASTLIGVELIHLMAIIQDDVMDNSDTRHGVMSAHTYIRKSLNTELNSKLVEDTSNSLAILLGDLAFAWAYQEFSKDNQTEESWSIIHLLLEEVILGQMMDVCNPVEKATTMEAIENKMLLKTARYTFTRPLLLGANLAGIKKEEINWITNFGDSMGLLFQMQDDIFDVTKDVMTLKKEPLGDMKNGIHTILSNHVVNNANGRDKELWATWFGNPNTNNQEEIRLFLVRTGAMAFAEEFINQKENQALDALTMSNLEVENIDMMKELLSAVTKRKY